MSVVPESLLGPRQLAAYLNVPVGTVYDWRHRGFGPPGFRLGKHVRYRRSDVDRWIDDQAKASIRVTR
jgi:excisionase family DNA binding protein